MFDYLDVLLALAIIAVLLFLLYKMVSYDKHMDDSRENGQFAPLIYHQESSRDSYRRNNWKMKKYGLVIGIVFILIFYVVLRINGNK